MQSAIYLINLLLSTNVDAAFVTGNYFGFAWSNLKGGIALWFFPVPSYGFVIRILKGKV